MLSAYKIHRTKLWWVLLILCSLCLFLKICHVQQRRKDDTNFEALSEIERGKPYTLKNSSCVPALHIYYLKIPKTGSSTMANVVHRIAYRNNLTMLTSLKSSTASNGCPNLHPLDILSVLKNDNSTSSFHSLVKMKKDYIRHKFDVYTPHSRFNHDKIKKCFKQDVKIVTNFRHPLKRLISHFYFRDFYKNLRLPVKNNHLEYFLQHATNYTNNFNNVMAGYLRFTYAAKINEDERSKYIDFLGKTINHAIITEKYDESLVLLRRKFCWNIKDILHFNFYKKDYKNKDNEDKIREYEIKYANKIKIHTQFDYQIYNYFLKKHMDYKKSEGIESVEREVKIYQGINQKVTNFCLNFCKNSQQKSETLKIEKNEFSESFSVSYIDCLLMSQPLLSYVQLIKQKQQEKICQFKKFKQTFPKECPGNPAQLIDPCNNMNYVQISN